MSLDATIEVECRMTQPPKPVGFGIRVGGRVTAVLTLEQVEAALAKFRKLQSVNAGGIEASVELFGEAVEAVRKLPGDDRALLMTRFCGGCGTEELPCNCNKDVF